MQPDAPVSKPRLLHKIKTWIHAHPARFYAIAGIGLMLAAGLTTAAILWQQPEETVAPKVTKKPAPTPKTVYYSPLTGEPVAEQTATTKAVTAIMIENSPDARPQSGLKDAEIVYEAVAEGGITRFLALYQQRKPETIGPVRSLRMYYVDWLTPYNASVAHIGGSAAALKVVRGGAYRDIDQFFNASYYERVRDRVAPHNVYTSSAKLDALNASKGYVSSNPKIIARGDDVKDEPQDATTVNIKISGPTYNSTYAYDPATKLYARSQGGAPHLDREAGQIQAKVVIALRVAMQKVFEDGYRESITTTGSGEVVIFQNGHVQTGTWFKDSREDQLRFTDAAGAPIKLARGTTWISAVPTTDGAVSWQ